MIIPVPEHISEMFEFVFAGTRTLTSALSVTYKVMENPQIA